MKIQVDANCRDVTKTVITAHNPNPSGVTQPIGVSFSVTSATGTPTGTVNVTDGSANCSASVLVGLCVLTPTSVGTKNIKATYSGDVLFNVSSSSISHKGTGTATATSITTHTPNPSSVSQPMVVSYIVIASNGITPTGNVKVTDGTLSCTGTDAAGHCTLNPTTDGVKSLKATYLSASTFSPNASALVTHTVNKNVSLNLSTLWK